MVFSSLEFIFRFLPIFLIIYYIVPTKLRNVVLILGSLFFYAYGDSRYLILIVLSILVNHVLVMNMNMYLTTSGRKIWLILALIYNFGFLIFFKYINFIIDNLNVILKGVDGVSLPTFSFGLPLGISFFTFQAVSYVVDAYKGELEKKPTFYRFATYLVMFPKLVSGPIATYNYMENQLISRRYTLNKFEEGLKYFVMGLGLKVLIANRIGILWNDIQTIGFESISTPLAWLGSLGYSLQLYFDFQGYSLMAIGVGSMLGFHLPDNFDHPYMSKSVTEFWRRWHISLGSWFREYVYIPLGGNRKGTGRMIFNMLIVWLFTGLWHGANWNFILWGLSLFVLILIEKLFLKDFLDQSVVFSRVYMVFVILFSWTLFAISDLREVGIYFGRMLGTVPGVNVNPNDFIKYLNQYKLIFIAGIFFCFPLGKRIYESLKDNIVVTIFLLVVFWYSVYMLSNGASNPFMYFQF